MNLFPVFQRAAAACKPFSRISSLGNIVSVPVLCDPLENPGMNKISFIYFLIKKAKNKCASQTKEGTGEHRTHVMAGQGETEEMKE